MAGDCSRVEAALADYAAKWRPDAWTPAPVHSARVQSYARALRGLKLSGGESCLLVAPTCLTPVLLMAQLAGRVRVCLDDHDSIERWQSELKRRDTESVEVLANAARNGAPDHAPFHAILVASPIGYIIPAWLDQLAVDARLVAPLGRPQALRWQIHQSTELSIQRADDLGPAHFDLEGPIRGPQIDD